MITLNKAVKEERIKASELKSGQMGVDGNGDVHYMDSNFQHIFFRVRSGWVKANDSGYKDMSVTPLPKGSTITITSEV